MLRSRERAFWVEGTARRKPWYKNMFSLCEGQKESQPVRQSLVGKNEVYEMESGYVRWAKLCEIESI